MWGNYRLSRGGTMNKKFIWEIDGYSGSVFAENMLIAEKMIKDKLCIMEVEQ